MPDQQQDTSDRQLKARRTIAARRALATISLTLDNLPIAAQVVLALAAEDPAERVHDREYRPGRGPLDR